MLKYKYRLFVGLIVIFVFVIIFYLVLQALLPKIALPATIGLTTGVLLFFQHKWRPNNRELRELIALVNLSPLFDGTFLPYNLYTMEPSALVELLDHVQYRQPDVVIECGTGFSTLLIGKLLMQNGKGHLYSFEEDQAWYEIISNIIDSHKLQDWVTVIFAPLESYRIGTEEICWYSKERVDSLANTVKHVDLVIVDGPKSASEHSRYPALVVLAPLLDKSSVVVLDDIKRVYEATLLKRWENEFSIRVDRHLNSDHGQAYIKFTNGA